MPVSRHSFRRVIGDMVNRHSIKNESTNGFHRNSCRSNKKLYRNSLISNDSLSVCSDKINKNHIYLFFLFDWNSHLRHIMNDCINVKKKYINH